MRYLIVDAVKQELRSVECVSFQDAKREAGLDRVDHGSLDRHHAIVVDEFGLYADPGQVVYFSLGNQLYAGNALLYACDDAGETTDMDWLPPLLRKAIVFYPGGRPEIEAAIAAGKVRRPESRVNGVLAWSWPQGMEWLERTRP